MATSSATKTIDDNCVMQDPLLVLLDSIGQWDENVHLLFGRVASAVCNSTSAIIRICSLCSRAEASEEEGYPERMCQEFIAKRSRSKLQLLS